MGLNATTCQYNDIRGTLLVSSDPNDLYYCPVAKALGYLDMVCVHNVDSTKCHSAGYTKPASILYDFDKWWAQTLKKCTEPDKINLGGSRCI